MEPPIIINMSLEEKMSRQQGMERNFKGIAAMHLAWSAGWIMDMIEIEVS